MSQHHNLEQWEAEWRTRLGAFLAEQGKVILRGRDLHTDLDDQQWMALLAFAITGRDFSAGQLALMEGLWKLAASYPDPRLWNNRIAALAGTTRSTANLGLAAGLAASDASVLGHRPDLGAFEFITRMLAEIRSGGDLESLVLAALDERRVLPGYGRPVRTQDERIDPIMKIANRFGLTGGPHTELAFEIEKVLIKNRRRIRINIAAVSVALWADQGLSSKEYYYLSTPNFTIGILACHLDASDHPAGSFFPLRCTRIDYEGPQARAWQTSPIE